ncbi:hypothetical protein K450DRAFT_260783 [Umbelopsis ramanniana AG]|uniref:Uncharacterized protein n=1 Tax=Umbelopsis ramanniana AG TaxID=1314678 RepID=A0AAD5E0Q3_UMBRA|nr:uncharacterized protein K450DRAFT_260783 [Umbelopsis ramanniana AG]KAI8575638.1 hypothetical protein K450DRAFT_260783 [Umbelopsis ramanniana AG]
MRERIRFGGVVVIQANSIPNSKGDWFFPNVKVMNRRWLQCRARHTRVASNGPTEQARFFYPHPLNMGGETWVQSNLYADRLRLVDSPYSLFFFFPLLSFSFFFLLLFLLSSEFPSSLTSFIWRFPSRNTANPIRQLGFIHEHIAPLALN